MDGWLNLHKSCGVSSHNALNCLRRIFSIKKMGYAGTLDPLAQGLLPVAVGRATRLIPYIMDAPKSYVFVIAWGERRSTGDREGDVIETSEYSPSSEEIISVLSTFQGKILQRPPVYSAIKINGKRSYALARQGIEVVLPKREVKIFNLVLQENSKKEAKFFVSCSKGTYIRSLGEDIAKSLGTCGHISYLSRETVGYFSKETSFSLDSLAKMKHNKDALLSMDMPLDDIPGIFLSREQAHMLVQGRKCFFMHLKQESLSASSILKLYLEGVFIGLGRYDAVDCVLSAKVIVYSIERRE